MAQKVRKGDFVRVIAGSEKGKEGIIASVSGHWVTIDGRWEMQIQRMVPCKRCLHLGGRRHRGPGMGPAHEKGANPEAQSQSGK